MVTATELHNSGYDHFQPHDQDKACVLGWQKRISDDCGDKYFITVYQRDWDKLGSMLPTYPDGQRYAFDVEIGFTNMAEDTRSMRVKFNATLNTVQQVESMADRIWKSCGQGYYERHSWAPAKQPDETPEAENPRP